MKDALMKISAILLVIWYCLSIIGFDVHSCTATGSIFVNSVLSGTTCDDIHPEHDCCAHGACCAHHSGEEGLKSADKGCCTNEIEVLDSEVVTFSGEDDCTLYFQPFASVLIENDYDALLFAGSFESFHIPDSGRVMLPDMQAVLNIWRI